MSVWTVVLEWSSSYGDLEPPLAVVRCEDRPTALTRAVELVSAGFAGVCQEWGCRHDVAERLSHVVTFRGDVLPYLASEGHAVFREPGHAVRGPAAGLSR